MESTNNPFPTRTKIVATVGPACDTEEKLSELIAAGVDVFRINTAHGNQDDFERLVSAVRQAAAANFRPIAILIDLAGPKIRLGELYQDPTHCHLGSTFRFIRGNTTDADDDLISNYSRLVDELSVGDRVMLADGTVSMVVRARDEYSADCEVTGAGTIRSRQGINLPGAKLSVPAMTENDIKNAAWAAEADIDFVSLSFVRRPEDIHQLREQLQQHQSDARIVAKIEKQEALVHLEDIVAAADAVMVARGDLGVEIDIAITPAAQKRIIEVCGRLYRPVIVATQMLDSMTHSTRPTRAEATDVANAILDGADACMLSGETAIGEHPRLVVEMMNRIMSVTEDLLRDKTAKHSTDDSPSVHPVTSAIVSGATEIARKLEASLIVIATRSGATALAESKQRDFVPTVGVSNDENTLRRMCLYWGIMPLAGAPVRDPAELRDFVGRWGSQTGTISEGDRVVFVTGTKVMPNTHNLVFVHEF